MDKFLEKYNLPKLNQGEAESLNRPITAGEIEAVVKKKSQHTKTFCGWFHRRILQSIQGRANPYPSQTVPKYPRHGKTPKLFLAQASILLIPNPDKDKTKREHYMPISLMNI